MGTLRSLEQMTMLPAPLIVFGCCTQVTGGLPGRLWLPSLVGQAASPVKNLLLLQDDLIDKGRGRR
jgi:hypothetical protein